jgi:hypothetical protein
VNTERPDNDDTTGTSGDVRGVGDAAKGSTKGPEVDDTGADGDRGRVARQGGRYDAWRGRGRRRRG